MFVLSKIPFHLLLITYVVCGCSTADPSMSAANQRAFTVNRSLLLDETPAARPAGTLRVSSISVTAPKAGNMVFAYADRMPTYYVSGATVSGGAKRADVLYKLEKDTEKLVANALRGTFAIDSTSPYKVSGRLDFKFTETPKDMARAGNQDVDVSIELTLEVEVEKNSVGVFKKSFQSKRIDTNKPGLLSSTFPTNGFLNTLFRSALEETLNSAAAEKTLAQAFGR